MNTAINQKTNVPVVREYKIGDMTYIVKAYVQGNGMDAQEEGITALYERFSQEDKLDGESNSIANQELICRGWFLPSNTSDCGSSVVN